MCDCEFTPYKDTDEESWHFLRVCEFCGEEWYGLHCPHDGYQNPCPKCSKRPTTVIYRKENKMKGKRLIDKDVVLRALTKLIRDTEEGEKKQLSQEMWLQAGSLESFRNGLELAKSVVNVTTEEK